MAPDALPGFEVDRSHFSVGSLDGDSGEKGYWLARTAGERFAAIEMTRRVIYGYGGAPPRLQRVLEVAELATG